jgi:hypothetical protein
MSRNLLPSLALAAVSLATPAFAQTPPADAPRPYTFVAQWDVPRAQWGTFVSDFEKNTRPVLEKLAADGTLTSWGAYETVVHTADGMTHGVWWGSLTYAGIEKARAELVKSAAASTSLAAATGHRDYLLRSQAGAGKPGSGTAAMIVSTFVVRPDQGQQWRQLFDKYTKTTYDDLVASGAALGYSLHTEDMHTDNPGVRFVVLIAASAEGLDKARAATDAVNAKRTPEERRAIGLQMDATMEPGTHRDIYTNVIRYWQK